MAKPFTIVCFLSVFILSVSPSPINEDGKAVFLGTFTPGEGDSQTRAALASSSSTDYFLLDLLDKWTEAKQACARSVVNSDLVAFESDEEIKFLNQALEGHGHNSYYTAGRYSVDRKGYVWDFNSLIYSIPSKFPWAAGFPEPGTSSKRIILHHKSKMIVFSTVEASELHGIICERRR